MFRISGYKSTDVDCFIIIPYYERGVDTFLKARGFDFSAPVELIEWVTM
jgi:hypothetical protein